ALKFTERGSVSLSIRMAREGWSREQRALNAAPSVIAFSVRDTGIRIPPHKPGIISEASQQGDGTPSRKYGGPGLGLSISREIARLLGGEIRLSSEPREGRTFTLYLPSVYTPADVNAPRPVYERTEAAARVAAERAAHKIDES